MKKGLPATPAIDEVLGDSAVDQKIREIAAAARAAGIRSLKDLPKPNTQRHVNGALNGAAKSPNGTPAKSPDPQNI